MVEGAGFEPACEKKEKLAKALDHSAILPSGAHPYPPLIALLNSGCLGHRRGNRTPAAPYRLLIGMVGTTIILSDGVGELPDSPFTH